MRDSVNPHIQHNIHFSEWEAASEFGATLDEMYKIETMQYPTWFRARLIAWHELHNLIIMHRDDAVRQKAKSKR